MKTTYFSFLSLLTASLLVVGCANESGPSNTAMPSAEMGGVPYHKDKDIQRVWLADGFDFNGYDALYIPEIKYAGKERSNEVELRTWAAQYLREALAAQISKGGIIPAVITSEAQIKPGSKTLKLEQTIYEYEKGGGGARYFAGLYGGGQPVIKVRGIMTDQDRPVFRFDAARSGESVGARMTGVFKSDKEIQTEDINDLAFDMQDFIRRTAKHISK